MKRKIIEKCWVINELAVQESHYLDGSYAVYAENRNKAKSKILEDTDIRDFVLNDGSEITYLNIPISRDKTRDKYDYDGHILTEREYSDKCTKEQRKKDLENILDDGVITHCHIKKNGMYYADNHCGYTDFISRAGVYVKDDAVSSALRCEDLDILPIDKAKHNEMIETEIKNLQNRLI